jgi:hypothetical protein
MYADGSGRGNVIFLQQGIKPGAGNPGDFTGLADIASAMADKIGKIFPLKPCQGLTSYLPKGWKTFRIIYIGRVADFGTVCRFSARIVDGLDPDTDRQVYGKQDVTLRCRGNGAFDNIKHFRGEPDGLYYGLGG